MNRLLSLLIALLPLCAFAQEEVGFTADRPGATTGVDVLPKGRFQWETGVAWERSKLDGPAETTWTINNSLLRLGLSEHAELRLQADYLCSSVEGCHYNGFSDVAIGTKVKLFEGWKAVPEVALLANVLIPGSDDSHYLPQEWGCQLGLAFQNQLTPRLALSYEGDLIWSDDSKPSAFYGLCLSFDLTDRLFLCLEEYNNHNSDGTECWSELSLGYMLTPRLQLDLGSDISLSHPNRYHNLMFGLSWQITK
ncbi:MAG: transporter [Prevotella sp.]|nr:transporter [Prevotella sp.]